MAVSDFTRVVMAFAVITAGGCGRAIASPASIMLKGFSQSNYTSLERSLNGKVCITGKLVVNSMGIYYPLQPMEKDGIITIGFSRISIEIDRAYVTRRGLKSGRNYTICGLLEDATPFKKCGTNHCKWYKLTEAQLRRRL